MQEEQQDWQLGIRIVLNQAGEPFAIIVRKSCLQDVFYGCIDNDQDKGITKIAEKVELPVFCMWRHYVPRTPHAEAMPVFVLNAMNSKATSLMPRQGELGPSSPHAVAMLRGECVDFWQNLRTKSLPADWNGFPDGIEF